MTTSIQAAAARLIQVLAAENAALLGLDIPAAAALLDEKLAAARGLAAASVVRPAVRQTPEAAGLALQLRDLAQQNRLLLENAIVVQGRVLDMVARAARQGVARAAGRYGSGGAAALDRGGRDQGAMALHLRA
jgi:hypothetical protein